MTVHFVDDDHVINKFHEITLKPTLEEKGIDIEFFEEPVSTLNTYQDTNSLPELIFLDINMPVLNGWEFLKSFTSKFPDAITKFVILTTSNNSGNFEKSMTYPDVLQFAIKPLKKDVLSTIIDSLSK